MRALAWFYLWERRVVSELWQLFGAFIAFGVALVLWFRIVYLPGRTLERWEDRRRDPDA